MTGVVVFYPFVGDTVGGSHLSMVPVIRKNRQREFSPLVAVHRNGPLTRYFDELGIDYVTPPSVRVVETRSILGQLIYAMLAAPALARFLRQHRVVIVHTNDARMHFTWGLAARLARCKFVWHQRSADPSRRIGQYSRVADRVLTISDYCRSVFAEPMSSRALVIKDPFDTESAPVDRTINRKRLIAELGCGDDVAIIGYVGNLTQQKRPLFFLDIAAAVRDRFGPKVCFPIFGEKREGLTAEVEVRITALGLGGKCVLMGSRFPIEPWIAACDVLVAPAMSEGLGRTLVEAMLAGTPVVAADDAGHREAIADRKTGRLIAPGDPVSFAKAIADLLNDRPAREAMTRRATAFAKSEFSSERHLNAIEAVYRELTESA